MKTSFLLLFFLSFTLYAESILDKVKALDDKIIHVTKSIDTSKEKITTLEKKSENSSHRIKKLRKENENLETQIKKRVKLLFKLIHGKAFLSFPDVEDALSVERKEKFLKLIIEHDLNLIKGYLMKVKEIREEINAFDRKIIELKNTKDELIIKKQELIKERDLKKAYLKKIRRSKKLKRRLQKERKKVQRKLAKKLKSKSTASSFYKNKGNFDFPVNAKVQKWYYVKYIKKKKSYDVHKGITFKVPTGTRVYSIYKGKVVYASYIKGYGNTLILSHGAGYYTIYMHLSKILKNAGDTIKSRDIVALTGDTGTTEYPKLYFEIRKKKEPINLNKWFLIRK